MGKEISSPALLPSADTLDDSAPDTAEPCSPPKLSTKGSVLGRLPIKWLALESLLRHEFSEKSDV
jgi:hypothetical protein